MTEAVMKQLSPTISPQLFLLQTKNFKVYVFAMSHTSIKVHHPSKVDEKRTKPLL